MPSGTIIHHGAGPAEQTAAPKIEDGEIVVRCPLCAGLIARWDGGAASWRIEAGVDEHGHLECPECGVFSCPVKSLSAADLVEALPDA